MIPLAVLDACVLYPPSLRDLLMRLAVARAYAPRWTEEIHAEWIRNVLADNPDVTPAQLERTRCLMNQTIHDSVASVHESHILTSHSKKITSYQYESQFSGSCRAAGGQSNQPDELSPTF